MRPSSEREPFSAALREPLLILPSRATPQEIGFRLGLSKLQFSERNLRGLTQVRSQTLRKRSLSQASPTQFSTAQRVCLSARMFGMTDVTQILYEMEQGDTASAEKLLPLVYEELRKLATVRLANEAPGQTLQPTELVHEAYVRMVDNDRVQRWDSRAHFFAAVAESMRRILVDRARRKLRPKHAGDRKRIELQQDYSAADDAKSRQLLALSEALEQLEQEDRPKAELVKLRYFAGMSLEEAASAMGISLATASRHWTYSKAWLRSALEDDR